jgi:GntR family transcriptional regulator
MILKTESIPPSPDQPKLERGTARALHEQLSDWLKSEFRARYAPGDQIPTEDEICRTYSLSRVTVRRAIQTLVDGGLLLRRQGKGTFLNQPLPHIVYEIDRFGPFMDALAAFGDQNAVHLLSYDWVSGKDVPACFGDETRALNYARLYETAGTFHAYLQLSLPGRIADRVSRSDTASMGVYQILRERLGIMPARATFTIDTKLPEPQLAQQMRVSPASPLLVLERISHDADDNVIERSIHHLLPDIYQLRVSANRDPAKQNGQERS